MERSPMVELLRNALEQGELLVQDAALLEELVEQGGKPAGFSLELWQQVPALASVQVVEVVVPAGDKRFPTRARPRCSNRQTGAAETAFANCGDNGHNAGKLRHRAKAVRRISDKRQDR
jgi:hypothetical protein